MLLTFNFFLVLFFLPGVPAPGAVTKLKVKQVLNDKEIRALLECIEKKGEKRTPEHWREQFPAVGNLALPVTRLALSEIKGVAVAGGWITSLAAHCAPLLYQLLVLTQEDIKAGRTLSPLVVVFNPKNNIDHADHKVCIEILQELKKLGVEISKFTNPIKADEDSELDHHFKFAKSLSVDQVIAMMENVNFLVISLCGVSVGNEEKEFRETQHEIIKDSGRMSCTATLRVALNSLYEVTKKPQVVLTLSSGNGRADDGTYPFENEHRITHRPTQYWPMGELAMDNVSKTRSFVLDSQFLDIVPQDNGRIEKDVLELARAAKKNIQKDIDDLKLNFKDNVFVEVELEAATATSAQDDAEVELTVPPI